MKTKQKWHSDYKVIAESFIDFLDSTNEKEVLASAISPLIKNSQVIVDVGAGTGELISRLTTTKRKIIAIEPCKDYIPHLTKKLNGNQHLVIPHKIENVNLPHSSVDAILFSHSLAYLDGFKSSIYKTFNWLKPGGIGVFIVLSQTGNQMHIMNKFWHFFHPNRPVLNPSAEHIEFLLSELGQDVYRKRVSSIMNAKTKEQALKLISFILEINPERLDGQTKNVLNLARVSTDGEYEINAFHEVIFFRKKEKI
ncbi:class I SAM-dependent methyltransferase [Candidatus Parcubacteria bacterium]|nr:MAG: class I SAM-dependent methyltransferase [Candidatus Parcubacteria bacterium]